MNDNKIPFGLNAEEIIHMHIKEFNFPVCFGFPAGHINNNQIIKLGVKSSLEIKRGNNGLFTFSNKRNIITNSSEYYNLSYEYINDCLRAGLVYRREFYNNSELEAENSLMFKITLSPFGEISSPKF